MIYQLLTSENTKNFTHYRAMLQMCNKLENTQNFKVNRIFD